MPNLATRAHRRSTSNSSSAKPRHSRTERSAPKGLMPLAAPQTGNARKARPAPLVFPEVHTSPTPASSRPASPNSPTFRVIGFAVPSNSAPTPQSDTGLAKERILLDEFLQPSSPTKTPTFPPTLDDWLADPKAGDGSSLVGPPLSANARPTVASAIQKCSQLAPCGAGRTRGNHGRGWRRSTSLEPVNPVLSDDWMDVRA